MKNDNTDYLTKTILTVLALDKCLKTDTFY